MTTFEYTHTRDVESDAVDEVHYNSNTRELAVDLHDDIYVYPNVSKASYENLVSAPSVGRQFREIKRIHGPSKRIGTYSDVNYVEIHEGYAAPDMGNVSPVRVSGTGTPKGLTYAPNATVDGGRVTLTVAEPARNKAEQFAVTFEVGGKSRTHTLGAESFGAAEDAVLEIGAMLDLTFDVKEIRKV